MSRPPLLPALGGRGGYTRRGVTQDGRLHMGGAASDKLLHRTCYTGCAVTGSDMLHRAGARGGRAAGARREDSNAPARVTPCTLSWRKPPLRSFFTRSFLVWLLSHASSRVRSVPSRERSFQPAAKGLENARLWARNRAAREAVASEVCMAVARKGRTRFVCATAAATLQEGERLVGVWLRPVPRQSGDEQREGRGGG